MPQQLCTSRSSPSQRSSPPQPPQSSHAPTANRQHTGAIPHLRPSRHAASVAGSCRRRVTARRARLTRRMDCRIATRCRGVRSMREGNGKDAERGARLRGWKGDCYVLKRMSCGGIKGAKLSKRRRRLIDICYKRLWDIHLQYKSF
jgi:hypothetical protein